MKRFILPIAALMLASPLAAKTPEEVAAAALKAAPIWDGHNDVGEQLRERRRDVIAGFDFNDTTHEPDGKGGTSSMHTDLPRLAKGHIGAQFWSVYVSADQPEPQAAVATIEQIDVMKRLIARYPDRLQLALTSADVERAMKAGKIASLTCARSTSMPIRCISRTTSLPKSVSPSCLGSSVALSAQALFLKCASVM